MVFCLYGILCLICMHPVGLCEKVSSSHIKTITTARKAHWLSVALKVIAGTLVLQILQNQFFCMKIPSALNGSAPIIKNFIACSKRSASETSEIDMIW